MTGHDIRKFDDPQHRSRAGWPDELRFHSSAIRVRSGRPSNLGEMARFWLQIHNGFRDSAARSRPRPANSARAGARRKSSAPSFAPRLQTLLSHLHGHHQIEDYQFFPLFSAAEPRLVRGFEVLERDHGQIHGTIDQMSSMRQTGSSAPRPATSTCIRRSGDAYAEAGNASSAGSTAISATRRISSFR